jgi:hypothetical protein
MRLFRHAAGWLACLIVCAAAAPARAEPAADPLRLVSDQADFAIKVEQPRQLVESLLNLDVVRQLQEFQAVREFTDSTNYRRFYQLIAYFEKRFEAPWPELLDRLAGGGVVLAGKFGKDPAPALFILQGSDAALMAKFEAVALELIEQEMARTESRDTIEKGEYRGIKGVQIGKEFFASIAGGALLISNRKEVLQAALDLHLDGGLKNLAQSASIAAARKLLPASPLAWGWLNLETVKQAPGAKEVLTRPRNDQNQTILFGSWLELAGRANFLCGAFARNPDGYSLALRLPSGRAGSSVELATWAAPKGQPAALPLLKPKGVLFSSSYFLDLSKFWENRAELFNEKQRKAFEDFDQNSGRFLAGSRFSQLLAQAGPHQRIVVANQSKPGYTIEPMQRFPAFALVVDMRDAENFPRNTEAVLRGAALLAGTQFKTKLVEEKVGAVDLVGYRFPEDARVRQDAGNIRFNFSPCFAQVKDQFLFCSTLELGRELVELLQKPGEKPDMTTTNTVFFATGLAELLQASEDTLLAQTILQQAVAPEEARQQVKDFIALVRRLGVVQIESQYGKNDFRYELRWKYGK